MFQPVVMQMKESASRMVGVLDNAGAVIACTDLFRIGETWESAATELNTQEEKLLHMEGKTFKALNCHSAHYDYAAFVEGTDDMAGSLCGMAVVALGCAKDFYDEKHDKATFVKNILLDNVLPGDIFVRGRELGLEGTQSRAVLLLRQQGQPDNAALDIIKSLFPDRSRDFVISLGEHEIALVKEVQEDTGPEELVKLAVSLEDTIKSELMVRCVIGIGSICRQIRDLARVYKEAQVAIDVGKVFETEKTIINYENLGLGRLIYQLPPTMCEMFLNEAFKKSTIDALDRETLETIYKFFDNNLNISETSRKLFVHRNTLVYRLEKIKKLTGLDLRGFDHAVIFKVALMVRKYLMSRNEALGFDNAD